MQEERIPKLIMEWTPTERRKRGRPRKTWIEGVQAAMATRNLEPDQWRNREEWNLVSGRRQQLLWNRIDGWMDGYLLQRPFLYYLRETVHCLQFTSLCTKLFKCTKVLHFVTVHMSVFYFLLDRKYLSDDVTGHYLSTWIIRFSCFVVNIIPAAKLYYIVLILDLWVPRRSCFRYVGYTGCFTTLGHNCRRWFPRFLWSEKFI